MVEKRGWFERPLAALCMLAGAAILSAYTLINSDGRRETGSGISYTITLRHYGCDAREMESSAAIPLEDALSAIPGIDRIVTMSENGRVRAHVNFRPGRGFGSGKDDYYDEVREAAQRVYETLPSSAQRPELSSSGDSIIPFWTAAVYGSAETETVPDGALLERMIKPALSAIEGVGEVEISGPGIREIVIALDREKSAALGLSPADISRVLEDSDARFLGGNFRYNGFNISIHVDGRYSRFESLEDALIPLGSGRTVRLGTVAEVREEEREAETLSRLNGIRTAVVSVTAASGADPGFLSRRIKKEIDNFSSLPLEFRVLEDRGAEESAAFRSVLAASAEASLLVALAAFLLGMGKNSGPGGGVISAAVIPFILIISAALLSAAGFPLNRKFLAGLAAGIGGAADAVILGAEGFGRAGNSREARMVLRGIWSPLVSGAATTAAALLPLMGIVAGDITVIAAALGTVTLVSVTLSLTLLPPLFLRGKVSGGRESVRPLRIGAVTRVPEIRVVLKPAGLLKKSIVFPNNFRRGLSRFLAAVSGLCVKRPLLFPAVSLSITVAAIIVLVMAGADTDGEWGEDSVYARIEFEGGFLKEEGDLLLAEWALAVKGHPAVKEVQTGARTGSGYGLVTFDPRKAEIGEIRKLLQSKAVPGAFVYIPEPSPGDRIWNITVSGDDAEKCRELANNAASLCSARSPVKETVLNFKQGGPRLVLVPKRELLASGGIPFFFPADTVRRGVHGPVSYKRTGDGGETDVRIRFDSGGGLAPDGADVLRIPLASNGNGQDGLYVASLTEAVKSLDASVIRRENRRRTASFSVRTGPGDPRLFRDKIMAGLKSMELPPLYRIEFDPEAISRAEALSGKVFDFILALLFCYMIIAAAEESFILPLIILSSVFPSLAVPVLVLCLSGNTVNMAVVCALVAVSGMTVNASVISAAELRCRGPGSSLSVYRAVRNRVPALVATSGTTIAGALPFLFLREGNNALLRILALVTVLGVGASFFCSITIVPSLFNLFFRIRLRKKQENRVPRCRDSNTFLGAL